MLFVADAIPSELRRVVEFLNKQMSPAEVMALELNQYEGEGLKTLVPRLYGQTEEVKQKKISIDRSAAAKKAWVTIRAKRAAAAATENDPSAQPGNG